jgi:hypothetical protein
MLTVLVFGPCEWVNDIVTPVDCSRWQSPGPLKFFFVLLSLLITYVLADAVYRGRLTFAAPVTKWIHQLQERRVVDLEAWEICLIGLPVGIYLFVLLTVVDGWSIWYLLFLIAPTGALLFYQMHLIAEIDNPHKDLPQNVQGMTKEELTEYNDRLEALNRTRELLGRQFDLLEHAKSLHDLNQQVAMLKKAFPTEKQDLELAGQVLKQRLKEKNVK